MIFYRRNDSRSRMGLPLMARCKCKMADGSKRLLTYSPTMAGFGGATVTKLFVDEKTLETFEDEVVKWKVDNQ